MTLGSLFDGIGGFPLAAIRNGITPVWASEIEAAPISISKRHFPDMKHLGDITKINGADIDPVDIITFGSPCQDLSVAGKRTGLEGGRSGLFMEAIRIIKEMREKTNGAYPRRIIWENVTGAFSSNRGEDFRTVLEEIAKAAGGAISIPRPPARDGSTESVWEPAGTVMGDGWSIAWRVLDAQYWGVPQRRKRIFLVGDFRGECAGEILFKPDSLPGDFAEGGAEGEGSAGNAKRGTGTAIPINTQNVFRQSPAGEGVGFGVGKEGDPAFSLQEGHSHAVGQYAVDLGHSTYRIQMNAKKAVTLRALSGGVGAKSGLYCLQGNMIGRDDKNGPQGDGINEDVCFTLNATDRHAVAVDCRNDKVSDKSGTLQAKPNGGQSLNYINPVATFAMQGFGDHKQSDNVSTLKSRDGKDSTDLITVGYIVRRLTPMECERLQGFPDGWTEYGIGPEKYRASLERGKKRTGLPENALLMKISDSARYKALGNSLAIPCAEFIFRRIKETA